MPRTTNVDNGTETIDSRDIIARIEALQEERQDWIEQGGDIPLDSPAWAAAANAWAIELGEDAAELEALPNIGPATAQTIIEYREAHGPFTIPEDILEVPGIGPATFEDIRGLITVE